MPKFLGSYEVCAHLRVIWFKLSSAAAAPMAGRIDLQPAELSEADAVVLAIAASLESEDWPPVRAVTARRTRRVQVGPDSGPDFSAYAVYSCPRAPLLCGIHTGGSRSWAAIEAQLPGQRLFGFGARLARFESVDAAVDAYYLEAARHRFPFPAPLFRH